MVSRPLKPPLLVHDYWVQQQLIMTTGYNSKLRIAFEHHGRQHYQHFHFFHRSEAAFQEQLKRDLLKIRLCEQHGIKLVVVPHFSRDIFATMFSQLEQFCV